MLRYLTVYLFVLTLVKTNNNDSRNFTGKVVLVTGSNSGIGREIVKLFSALGANVVVTGRNVSRIRSVAQEAQQLSPNRLQPLEVAADLTVSNNVRRLLYQTIITFGRLDILVNNAAIIRYKTIRDPNFMQFFDDIIATDLRPYIELSHLSFPFLELTNGTIILVSSMASIEAIISEMPICISYAAINMMTRELAIELGPRVRVNSVNPGVTDTPMINFPNNLFGGVESIREAAANISTLRRIGKPSDVAKGVVFLASTDAQYITGINLFIEGGQILNDNGGLVFNLLNSNNFV